MNSFSLVRNKSDLYGLKNVNIDQVIYCIKDNSFYHLKDISRQNKSDGWEIISNSGNTLTNNIMVSMPVATISTLGGIIVGSGLSITNGVLSATGGGGSPVSHASLEDLDYASAGHTDFAPIDSPVFTTKITTPYIYGGTAANGDIYIEGTSNVTKTSSFVYIQPNNGGVVLGAPSVITRALNIGSGMYGSDGVYIEGSIELPLNRNLYIGSTSDANQRLRLHAPTASGDAYIDYYDTLRLRSGVASSTDRITISNAGIFSLLNTGDTAITNYGGLTKNTYVSQLTGYRISANGEADFRYLYADELHVKSFIADLEQALAGGQIVSKSVAKIASDFTIPAAGAAATLVVEEFAGYTGAVFVDGDMIRLRQFSRANNTTLDVADVWGTVVYVSRDSTANPTTQTFTFTRSAAPNAGTGSGTIKTGSLALDYGTTGNGYYEVTAVDGINGANSPYSQCVTWTTHPVSGLSLKCRLGNLAGITDTEFSASPLSGYGLYSSNVYLTGKVVLPSAGITNEGSATTSIRIYAGDTYANRASAPFRVTQAGNGFLGGFTLDSTEGLYTGSGSTRVQLKAGEGIWLGATAFADATFSVNPAGEMIANGTARIGCKPDGVTGFGLAIWTDNISELAYNGDNSQFSINRYSYGGGTSYYRNTIIYDGKGSAIVQFIGNGATAEFTGSVSIGGVINTNAILTLTSTTKGFLVPRMTSTQINALTAQAGMIVYSTDGGHFYGYTNAWRQLD